MKLPSSIRDAEQQSSRSRRQRERYGSLGSVFSCVALGAALVMPAQAADAPTYDDPGMHFKAPDGFERVDSLPAAKDSDDDAPRPAAVFVYHRGQRDQRSIVIEVHDAQDSLEGFTSNHTQDLHKGSDTARVDQKEKTTLANGMPAYFMRVSSGEGLQEVWRYEYLIVDGTRDIDVSYSARQGELDAQTAKAALASLYVVVYPTRR